MELFQRLRDFRKSLSSGLEPRFDPRCWDSAMYTAFPGADHPAASSPPVYRESPMTHFNFTVPL
jgi:hypothetical protein